MNNNQQIELNRTIESLRKENKEISNLMTI